MKNFALALTLLLFSLTFGACAGPPSGNGSGVIITADDQADGIGTSPSDPEGLALLAPPVGQGVIITVAPPVGTGVIVAKTRSASNVIACGLWVAGDSAALGCSPADVAVWPSGASCVDLIHLADARWPGLAVVRQMDAQLRAVAASCL